MRSKFKFVTLFAFAAIASPAFADRAMTCVFPSSGTAGFAVGEVQFKHKSGESEAILTSTVSEYFKAGDVKAKVVVDDPKLLALNWTVKTKNDKNQYATIKYTLKIKGDGKSANLRAEPLAYDNEWSNSGSCKPLKG